MARPNFHLPFAARREHQQVNAVIRMHSIHGKTAQQDLPLYIIDTQISKYVLTGSQFAFVGLALPSHVAPYLGNVLGLMEIDKGKKINPAGREDRRGFI